MNLINEIIKIRKYYSLIRTYHFMVSVHFPSYDKFCTVEDALLQYKLYKNFDKEAKKAKCYYDALKEKLSYEQIDELLSCLPRINRYYNELIK